MPKKQIPTTVYNKWIACPKQKTNAQLRLFCVPYAGGGPHIFKEWTEYLPERFEICIFQIPGRGNRFGEKPFNRLSTLVVEMASAIQNILDIPFAIFGHSMGALVAFELARELRRIGGFCPIHLFVSGHRAPNIIKKDPPIHTLSKSKFLHELQRLNGTPKEILGNTELMDLMLPALRADFECLESYQYVSEPLLKCPISAYGGLQDREISRENLERWREQTKGPFVARMFPGGHFFINTDRLLLLKTISLALEKSFQNNPQRIDTIPRA